MAKRPTLHEAIQAAAFAANVEVIDVPVSGGSFCLLRTTAMPEFAFLMASVQNYSAFCQMAFTMPRGGRSDLYPVICGCCSPERKNHEPPAGLKPRQRKAWEKSLAREFRAAIANTCQASGVLALFVRRALSWKERYGRIYGLTMVEAARHQEIMADRYPVEVVQRALQFIDYEGSRGLKQFIPPFELTPA